LERGLVGDKKIYTINNSLSCPTRQEKGEGKESTTGKKINKRGKEGTRRN